MMIVGIIWFVTLAFALWNAHFWKRAFNEAGRLVADRDDQIEDLKGEISRLQCDLERQKTLGVDRERIIIHQRAQLAPNYTGGPHD